MSIKGFVYELTYHIKNQYLLTNCDENKWILKLLRKLSKTFALILEQTKMATRAMGQGVFGSLLNKI